MWDILYLQAFQGLPPAHAAPHGPGKHQESQKHPSASGKAADWEENLKDVDVLHPSTSQAEQGMLNPGLFQSPTAKDAPRSSPKFRPPVSYPGSPCSWSSLGAIRSLASLKSTQRETQTVQICRCPPALQPRGGLSHRGRGRSGGCHAQGGGHEAGDPPQEGVPGCWDPGRAATSLFSMQGSGSPWESSKLWR